jgi:hypothetical protein
VSFAFEASGAGKSTRIIVPTIVWASARRRRRARRDLAAAVEALAVERRRICCTKVRRTRRERRQHRVRLGREDVRVELQPQVRERVGRVVRVGDRLLARDPLVLSSSSTSIA